MYVSDHGTTMIMGTSIIVLLGISCFLVQVYAREDDSSALKKRSYNSFCQRCMASDFDWWSCFKCSSGRNNSNEKRADPRVFIFPEEQTGRYEKRASLFKCSCCMRTGDKRCCAACENSYDRR